MIKKILLSVILLCMLISCGKKGDPVYKDTEKSAVLKSDLIIKI